MRPMDQDQDQPPPKKKMTQQESDEWCNYGLKLYDTVAKPAFLNGLKPEKVPKEAHSRIMAGILYGVVLTFLEDSAAHPFKITTILKELHDAFEKRILELFSSSLIKKMGVKPDADQSDDAA